jgi:hypothetical protein
VIHLGIKIATAALSFKLEEKELSLLADSVLDCALENTFLKGADYRKSVGHFLTCAVYKNKGGMGKVLARKFRKLMEEDTGLLEEYKEIIKEVVTKDTTMTCADSWFQLSGLFEIRKKFFYSVLENKLGGAV